MDVRGVDLAITGPSGLHRNSPQRLNVSSLRVFNQIRDPETFRFCDKRGICTPSLTYHFKKKSLGVKSGDLGVHFSKQLSLFLHVQSNVVIVRCSCNHERHYRNGVGPHPVGKGNFPNLSALVGTTIAASYPGTCAQLVFSRRRMVRKDFTMIICIRNKFI